MSAPARQIATTKGNAALSLRLAGASYEEIVDTIGFKDVKHARQKVNEALAQNVTDDERLYHRQLAWGRLETLLDAVWDKANSPENSEQLVAVRAAKEIIRDMVQLHGAAAPQELIIHNPSTSQLVEWMRENGMIKTPEVEDVNPFIIEGEVVEDD